jgi:DNA-binding transcriptional LysR family regulator
VKTPDLNLLIYLDALIKYGSATKVAEVLGVSQPGVSAALRRLRTLLDDPVMIRSGHRLLPTPKAFDINQQMAGSLALWQSLSEAGDIAHAKNYSVLASDYIQLLLLPRLIPILKSKAPEVSINVVPTNPFRRLEMVTNREVDMAIGYYNKAPENLRFRQLFQEKMVCVMSSTHPKRADFGIDSFLAYPHVAIASVSSGSYMEEVENTLRKLGVVRKIALTTPSYNVVPAIITQTNYLSILPLSIATYAQQQHPILIKEVPVDLPKLAISIFYHGINQDSRSHMWFRNCVLEACQGL